LKGTSKTLDWHFTHISEDRQKIRLIGGVLIWISLCNLCVLCVSVVIGICDTTTTETQRTQSFHREDSN